MSTNGISSGPTCHSIALVRDRYRDALARWAPGIADAGDRAFAAVTTPNWALEWGLADWLTDAYGLEREMADELLLGNVTLLAFARLMDDVADGESHLPARTSVPLAAGLLHSCVGTYARVFAHSPERERFERCFDSFLGEWMQATLDSARVPGPDFTRYTSADFARVAERAAFLKIGAAAGCLAARRSEYLDALLEGMTELCVGIVMLDDHFDWPGDLMSGRFNVFVAYGARGPQTAELRDANKRAMIVELYCGGRGRPYFAALHDHLDLAGRAADAARCDGLGAFIEWYGEEAQRCADWLAQRTHDGLTELGRREAVASEQREG
jgi:hypothetical protein